MIFKVGDFVSDIDGERQGTVVQVRVDFNTGKVTQYKVQELDGPKNWRDAGNLKKATLKQGVPKIKAEAKSLSIFIENDTGLNARQTQSILKNLARKVAKGTFDFDKSLVLWGYLVESGAKKYTKDMGGGSKWFEVFDPLTRKQTAKLLAESFADEIKERALPKKAGSKVPGRFMTLPRIGEPISGFVFEPKKGWNPQIIADALDQNGYSPAAGETWNIVLDRGEFSVLVRTTTPAGYSSLSQLDLGNGVHAWVFV